eukprot:3729900-Alexandrium_andersonii.AAC.1
MMQKRMWQSTDTYGSAHLVHAVSDTLRAFPDRTHFFRPPTSVATGPFSRGTRGDVQGGTIEEAMACWGGDASTPHLLT